MSDSTQISTPVEEMVRRSRRPPRTRGRRARPPTPGAVRLRLAAALLLGALVTVSIGLLERHMLAAPHPIPYFHLFFSDTLFMKAWLASATLVLAGGQLVWAAGMYGLVRFTPQTRFFQIVHRWAGRVAMALTLPVAFNCLFEMGINPLDLRIMVHAVLGAFIYGIFVVKFFVIRIDRAPGWMLPILGSALFTTIVGLWYTSAYWLFSLYGWHL